MAQITRRRSGELVRGVFMILDDHPEGLQAKELLQRLERRVTPTDFEASTYPNRPDTRRYEKIVRFSTINAVKAGWLIKSKGQWSLTDEGRRALRTYEDPEQFYREAIRLYRQWARGQEATTEEEPEDVETAATLEEAEEAAWSEIEQHLGSMNPYDFQQLVGGLLRGMGYYVSWIAPPGRDGGTDIVAHVDPLGLAGPRIKVQVKRSADKMAVSALRSFMAVLADADVGMFVCTGGFTKDAEHEARTQEKRRLMLVDSQRLFDLWVEHYAKVPEEHRRLLPLRAVYFLVPDE